MKFPLEKVWSQGGKVNTAYYCAKNERPAIFLNLKNYKRKSVRDIGKAYLTDKKCAEFTKYIVNVIREELEWFE